MAFKNSQCGCVDYGKYNGAANKDYKETRNYEKKSDGANIIRAPLLIILMENLYIQIVFIYFFFKLFLDAFKTGRVF